MIELLSKVSVKIKKENREYELLMPQGAPCGEAYDVCFEMLQEIIKMAENISNNAKRVLSEKDNS